jgi:hypothetical protein
MKPLRSETCTSEKIYNVFIHYLVIKYWKPSHEVSRGNPEKQSQASSSK